MQHTDISILKQKIIDEVNHVDPWHLIEMGAPEDEYNRQADSIISFILNKKPDHKMLESELFEIFSTKEFELDRSMINKLAENLISLVAK